MGVVEVPGNQDKHRHETDFNGGDDELPNFTDITDLSVYKILEGWLVGGRGVHEITQFGKMK